MIDQALSRASHSAFSASLEINTSNSAASIDEYVDYLKNGPESYLENVPVRKISDDEWSAVLQSESILTEYPEYPWKLALSSEHRLQFDPYHTISRHLYSSFEKTGHTCPYGDQPAPIARITKTNQPQIVRDAHTLSALRFQLSPFRHQQSTQANRELGIPESLSSLYAQKIKASVQDCRTTQLFTLNSLRCLSWQAMKNEVSQLQQEMRFWYFNELVPLMNANPFDPLLHSDSLSSDMCHDLQQYVELQNCPCEFFDLMQWLERDVVFTYWYMAQSRHLCSLEKTIVWVMTGWRDRDGHRRKKPILCPIGVPLGYMQSLRRKDQPFITQEFSYHAHGGLNHWLQEHIWQRFCDRYPHKHRLHPSNFFKRLGYIHIAFADAIYELHMPNLANPANTNFWSVLQYYLPLMSPWP